MVDARRVIRERVAQAIRKMKREGTTGASLPCLRQCTPTLGVHCAPSDYNRLFQEAATEQAKVLRFRILS